MALFALFSLLYLLTGAASVELHHGQQRDVQLPAAGFTLPLTAKIPRREVKKNALAALGKHPKANTDTLHLDGAAFEHEYLVNITVGGKPFQVILDSGSSDLWVAHSDFGCLDLNGTVVPPATCNFGPAQFDPSQSSTFEPFANVTFFVRYGSGEFLSGPAGFDTISVGGLSVTQQEIGVPDSNAFLGDGVSEGVLGLAFSGLTSVWNTTDRHNAGSANHILYTPFFLNAVVQDKLDKPYFSIALNRPTFAQQANVSFVPDLGFLSFGGIAPVPVLAAHTVTLPVQAYDPHTFVPSNAPDAQFEWYAVDVGAYTFPGSDNVTTASNNTILDTGSTMNWFPTPVAAAFNALWSPPAVLDGDTGLYTVECNATAPAFAVVLGNTSFTVDARDLVIPQKDAAGNTFCVSGNGDGGPDVPRNLFTLGDVFLHNVVATFNPIDAEVTVTQRAPY
ncbi:acid protease [Mycena filopes]|nr:acid protease [Mycena filopes]